MAVSDTALRAAGVYVSLGGMPVLRDVAIEVCPAQLVALLGSNGSGKSTFVRALLGLIGHTAGEISWFGTPLSSFRDWSRIGYVPQRSSLQGVNATVTEVVASGLLPKRKPFRPLGKEGKKAIEDALCRVELADRASWPMTKLSGGQQQRALIARALVGGPDIVVLDEPMAGIDLKTQDRLAGLFAELKSDGLAMLVVLHEQGALARLVDHRVTLHDGRVAVALPEAHDAEACPGTHPGEAGIGLLDPMPEAR
ncbi:MAG: ATP-binding cassette domain-containing protein [Propionibacteriaceae bacterium]|nr:ATP-binding cassette domain-containing protein [Propionibacteriaceae bacterium]